MPQQHSSGSGAMHMGHVSGSVHNITQVQTGGDGAFQVGQVNGDLLMDHSTHHSSIHHSAVHGRDAVQVMGQVAGGVHVTHVTTHQHIYAPAPLRPFEQPAANDTPTTPEQREVLAQMKKLNRRAYNQVVAFMRREFDTGLVNQLNSQQLYRVRRYVQTIRRNVEQAQA